MFDCCIVVSFDRLYWDLWGSFFLLNLPMYTSIKSFFEKCLSANKLINCPYSVAWPNDHPYFIAVPKDHPYFIALDLDSQEGILPLR